MDVCRFITPLPHAAAGAAELHKRRSEATPAVLAHAPRRTKMKGLTYEDVVPVIDAAVKQCPGCVLRRDVLTAAAHGLATARPEDPVAFVVGLLKRPMEGCGLPRAHRQRSAPTVRRPVNCLRDGNLSRPQSAFTHAESPAKPAAPRWSDEELEQAAAVNKIGAVRRGQQDRARVYGMRIERELGLTGSAEEQAAIARMQAQQRGKQDRARVRQLKGRRIEAALGLTGSEEEQASIARMQAQHRGKQDRAMVAGMKIERELGLTGSKEEQAAIARMQAQQRGKVARRDVAQMKASTSLPPWVTPVSKVDDAWLPSHGNFLGLHASFRKLTVEGEQTNAARDIQAIVRRKQARTRVAGMKIEAALGLTGSEEEQASIARMQAQHRGKQDRAMVAGMKIERELGLTGSKEEQAAIARMQAQHRGKTARKEMGDKGCASR